MNTAKKISLLFVLISISSFAQQTFNTGEIHGNVEMNAQYYQKDTAINTPVIPEDLLMNGFANLIYTNGKFSAGVRYESYLNAINGFPVGYKGTGIPYRYASFKSDELEVTVGSFYEQFGNGLIFRSYEERALGYDNAMDGFKVKYKPYKGIYLKGLIGKQRKYFTTGEGIVRGFDGEIQMNELINSWSEKKLKISIGGSFVSRFSPQTTVTINDSQYVNLPQNVGASAGRFTLNYLGLSIGGEYAYKINDPTKDNNYIYKNGEAVLLFSSYSQKGISISFNVKRVDNMLFRSDLNGSGQELLVNYIPALARQHTYGLMAFYPYATQPKGEINYQTELNYKFKKETLLGGKYGMDLSVSYASSNALDTTIINPVQDSSKRMGYSSDYFSFGPKIFKDFILEVNKKFSKKLKTTFMYSYQEYNEDVINGTYDHKDYYYSHIGVADITYKLNSDHALRLEMQHSFINGWYYAHTLSDGTIETKKTTNNWAQALLEYTIGSHWFVAVQDQFNYGNPDLSKRFHYYYATAGFVKNANRITLGYGRQRDGIFCVGGVCRRVPSSNGITLSITSSF